jgi:hypothetical protein
VVTVAWILIAWFALSVLAGCLIYPLLKIAAAEDEAMRRLAEGGDNAN